MVTGFICDTLRKAGVRPDISQPHTHNAGPVEHICTRIKATFPKNMGMIELLCNLAPTPAVSGYPRETALQMISTHEKHRRRHYGGTIGVYESTKRFRLFVNLRSMRVSSGRSAIYTGGGITSKSDPEEEWLETCIKASTLLSVISKHKH